MNRLVCTSTDAIDPSRLPPPRRERGGPARVLFLHTTAVGFATTTASLEHYTGPRADIDAVHVRVVNPAWSRWFCAQLPFGTGGLDLRYLRHMLAARRHLRSLVGPGRPLPLDRFDVVHIMTQQRGAAVLDLKRPDVNTTGTKFAINLDATLVGRESMRGEARRGWAPDHAMEARTLQAADLVACASEWCAGSVERDCAAPRDRIVIHKPCARVPEIPRRETRTAGPINLLFIGGVWADKGGPLLLAWHQSRWADRATLHVVSGSAPRDDSARNVVWHGRVPHDRLLRELLPAADVLVVPTRWDTFLIAAQEAQAAGVPVVTTRTGAVPEVVRDGLTGFLCDAHDDAAYIRAVETLMNDPERRELMSITAREHAARDLSADVWHTHLLDQLVALADARPPTRRPARCP